MRLDEADAGAWSIAEQNGFSTGAEERAGNVGGEPAGRCQDQKAGIEADKQISKEGVHGSVSFRLSRFTAAQARARRKPMVKRGDGWD